MICEHCVKFMGYNDLCMDGHCVTDGLEASNCDDYLYNGGVCE